MARRWKGYIFPEPPTKDLIKHSISKYKEVTYVAPITSVAPRTSLTQNEFAISTKHVWSKEVCENYIATLQARGFVKGAPVKTKWNTEGVFNDFIPIPEKGLEFFHQKYPNVFSIVRPIGSNNVLYNEEEIQLLTIIEGVPV